MVKPKTERRSQKRVPVHVPVEIRNGQNSPDTGYTRDVSRSGIFLYSDGQITEGAKLELVLMLPPELTDGAKQWVCCQADVVRVENEDGRGRCGIAAELTNIVALPEITA